MSKFKAGYHVVITSSENDADNYNTVDVHTNSLSLARFIKDFCEIWGNDLWGNENTDDKPNAAVWEEFQKHKGCLLTDISNKSIDDEDNIQRLEGILKFGTMPEDFENYWYDLLYDYGLGIWAEGQYWRICDKVEIYRLSESGTLIE